jgi:hypothetical protein
MKRILYKDSSPTPVLWGFLFSVFTIFSGGLIYILLRPEEPVFFDWFKSAGLEDLLFKIRQYSLSFNLYVPDWFIYSLPNGLWAFSYSVIITVIWWGSKSHLKYFWIASIPVFNLGFEFMQYSGILRGTFCIPDMVFSVLGIIAGVTMGIIIKIISSHEKNMV